MKKKYIKNFYKRDEKALIAIAKCGHVTKEQLLTIIKEKRIYYYERDGLIKKEKYYHSSNGFEGYRLTKIGKRLVEKEWGFSSFQYYETLFHDSIIADKFFSLSEKEQNSWLTDKEIQAMLEERKGVLQIDEKYSALDAIYTNTEGVIIGFEAITRNYSLSERKSKLITSQLLQIKLEEGRR